MGRHASEVNSPARWRECASEIFRAFTIPGSAAILAACFNNENAGRDAGAPRVREKSQMRTWRDSRLIRSYGFGFAEGPLRCFSSSVTRRSSSGKRCMAM